MKTTIEISDAVLAQARKLAERRGTTLRALVEEGLRKVVAESRRQDAFRLRKASFKGEGLQERAASLGWERLREMVYEDRGD
jgi:Arc/MetJ family transcription regulator